MSFEDGQLFSSHSSEISQGAMRTAFADQSKKVLEDEERFRKPEGNLRVGVEVKYSLLNADFSAMHEMQRDELVSLHSPSIGSQPGASQIEIKTPPVYLQQPQHGLYDLEEGIKLEEQKLIAGVRQYKGHLLRLGANPLVPLRDIPTSSDRNSRELSEYFNARRQPGIQTTLGFREKVEVADASIIGITNAIHCNIEADSFSDAINKTNRAFALGPMLFALAGNARFYDGKDTGYSDARMETLEMTHDTRTWQAREQGRESRIGLPNSYYADMQDYFQRILIHPFLEQDSEKALTIGIANYWQDARIKILNTSDDLVVEFRPTSAQKNPFENACAIAFYLGRLQWSEDNEALMSLDKIKDNRRDSMRRGMTGELWTTTENGTLLLPSAESLLLELDRAEQGLITLGFSTIEINHYLTALRKRVADGTNPSHELSQKVHVAKEMGMEKEEAIVMAMNTNGNIA